jgi:LAGLIDADG-like domain
LSNRQFLAFLAGLFDAEGTIFLHKKSNGCSFELSISNTDVGLLEDFSSGLKRFGYHPYLEYKTQDESRLGYRKEGAMTVLCLLRQAEVCDLLSQLRLRHDEKVEKSEFVRSQVCANRFGIGEDQSGDWKLITDQIKRDRDAFVKLARERKAEDRDRV